MCMIPRDLTQLAARGLALVCLLLAALAVPGWAQDETPVPPVSVAGEWEVNYSDRWLGQVSGTAVVSKDETSARVVLTHPESGEQHVLTSSRFERSGRKLEIVLEGRSPRSRRETGRHLPFNPVTIPEATAQLTISYGESRTEISVARRAESDLDRITLKFHIGRDSLAGNWLYKADPVTHRDTEGYGRSGFESRDANGVSRQIGLETWRRPKPLIYGAFTIENQLADVYGEPAYSYPFQPGHGEDSGVRRHLFVFGRNLPRDYSKDIELRSDTPAIKYLHQYRQWDADRGGFARDQFSRGWQKLLAGLPESEWADARKLDAVIIRVDLMPGVVPGHHGFHLNDAPGGWLLQFGDNSAEVSFVRQTSDPETAADYTPAAFRALRRFIRADGTERTGELYLPEAVALEVRTHAQLPVEEIPLLLHHNGAMVTFEDGQGPKIMARRTADPKVYRTAPLHLATGVGRPVRTPGGAITLPSSLGSQLSARLGVPELISVAPGLAMARVLRRRPQDDTLWHEALGRVAACRGEPVTSWRELGLKKSKTLTNRVILQLETRRLTITYADQAAMILLKDRFLVLMRQQHRELNVFQTDQEILAFRGLIEPLIRDRLLPIGEFTVADPNGDLQNFALTYNTYSLAESYRLTVPETDRWVLDATRQVIRDFRRSIGTAIETAEAAGDCDPEALLEITGLGFDAVVATLMPRLMTPFAQHAAKLSPADWSPDRPARAAVQGIAVLGEALRAQEDYSELDTKLVQVAVTVATLPLAFGTSAVGTLINHAVDTADLAQVAFSEIPETWKSHQEYDFARGASAVLGTYRMDLAEQNLKSWTAAYFQGVIAVGSFAFNLSELPTIFRKFQSSRLVAGARRALKNLPELRAHTGDWLRRPRGPWAAAPPPASLRRGADADGPDDFFDGIPGAGDGSALDDALEAGDDLLDSEDDLFSYLPEHQAEDLAAAAAQAGGIDALVGRQALDPEQRALLEQVDAAQGRVAAGELPEWADGLDANLIEALRPHLDRPDLHRMMLADRDAAVAVFRQDREFALSVLDGSPHIDPRSFEAAVRSARKRRNDPLGKQFYRQANPRDKAQMRRLEKELGITFAGDQEYLKLRLFGPSKRKVSISATVREVRRDPVNNEIIHDATANYHRSYERSSGTLVMKNAQLNEVSHWLNAFDQPLVPGRGIPTHLFENLRLMQVFKIGYGGSGNPLRKVVLDSIINPRSAVQLGWLMKIRPGVPVEELLPHTFSYQYAESILTLSGYRIKGTKYVSDHDPDFAREFEEVYKGREPWSDFLERHGILPDELIPNLFEIHLDVESIPGAAAAGN